MTTAEIKIRDMKQVISDTEGKTDLVSKWARQGVKSEAGMNIAYLKRRLDTLNKDVSLFQSDITKVENFIKQLEPIYKSK